MRSDTYAALDLEAQPQGYRLWKPKARGYLMGKFPQVGRILDWAEKQLEPINEAPAARRCRPLDGPRRCPVQRNHLRR
eukprot:12625131-Alexandrium_andersonii.AAC.1